MKRTSKLLCILLAALMLLSLAACGGGKPRITYTGAYTAQSYTADGKPFTLYTLTGSGTLTVRGRARHAGVWLCGGGANGMTGGSDENRPANFG